MALGISTARLIRPRFAVCLRRLYSLLLLLSGLVWTLPAQAQQVSTLTLNPNVISSGSPTTGTVVLTSAAPAGGANVALSSDNYAATVPASVLVAAGQTGASFTVNTSYPGTHQTANITATYNSSNKTAALTIVPPLSKLRLTDVSLASFPPL